MPDRRWFVIALLGLLAGCDPASDVLEGAPSSTTMAWSSSVPGMTTVATTPTTAVAVPPREGQLVSGTVTLLEDARHPPFVCAGVDDSSPPGCHGAPVHGLDWSEVDGAQTLRGVTWGHAYVTGLWDGAGLTLTTPPEPPRPPVDQPNPAAPFPLPCPEPAGGWFPAGPPDAGELFVGMTTAESFDELSAVWVSYPGLTETPTTSAPGWEPAPVLVVAVTTDVAGHEQRMRAAYTGPLCVFERPGTAAEARALVDAVDRDALRAQGIWVTWLADDAGPRVWVGVMALDDVAQRWIDETFPPGTVEVMAHLRPVA